MKVFDEQWLTILLDQSSDGHDHSMKRLMGGALPRSGIPGLFDADLLVELAHDKDEVLAAAQEWDLREEDANTAGAAVVSGTEERVMIKDYDGGAAVKPTRTSHFISFSQSSSRQGSINVDEYHHHQPRGSIAASEGGYSVYDAASRSNVEAGWRRGGINMVRGMFSNGLRAAPSSCAAFVRYSGNRMSHDLLLGIEHFKKHYAVVNGTLVLFFLFLTLLTVFFLLTGLYSMFWTFLTVSSH